MPAIEAAGEVADAVVRLASLARRLDVPVTVSEQYPKGLGATVESVRAAVGNTATTLQKIEFSCLANETLARRIETLTASGREQLVVAGIEAHVCVLQTVLDLADNGQQVFVVAAAIGSRAAASKQLALQRMRDAGATIIDVEMAMFEWLERAGTPEFKELQAGLKVPSRP